MPELRCDVHSCTHNKNMYCDLEQIEVGGSNAKTPKETSCNSFVERKEIILVITTSTKINIY